MMESLRKASGTWLAKFLLMILVVSFAAVGVYQYNPNSGNTVVRAGNTTISPVQYRLAYDRQLTNIARATGQQLSRQEAKAFGIDQGVLQSMVDEALIQEQSRKLGLGISKDRIASLTAQDTAFQGADGRFDQRAFDAILRQVGMRPQEYFDDVLNVGVRQQIVQTAIGGLRAPDAFLRATALYRGEDRTVDFIVLPQTLVPAVEEPAADVLAAWFETLKARYAAPEYRKIDYVRMDPEDIADLSAVTDKQVEDDYEARKARYTTAETRAIEQLVFPNREAADAALDSIRNGATFAQVVQNSGKTEADTQLGTVTRDRIPDAKIAEAAFGLSLNQVSDVVDGAFGPVLVRVTAITPEVVRPLEEVREEIRKELAVAEANRVLLDTHDTYEDARAGGDSLRAAAEKLKLKVVTIDAVDRTGKRPDGTQVEGIPSSAQVLDAAFKAQSRVESPPVNSQGGGYVFYEVDSVTPARDRTLEEVKDRATADWKAEQLAKRLEEKANELDKRVTDGATLDTIATELSLEKQTKRGLKREADDPDFGEAGVTAAFSLGDNGVASVLAPDGKSRILFKVIETIEPAGVDAANVPEDQRNQFDAAVARDVLEGLTNRLRGEYDIEVFPAVAEQALSNF